MAKRFDSTTKQLVEEHPADWLALAGLPSGPPAEVVDADLSSFTLAADKLIRVGGPDPYIGHIELQAGADPRLDRRVLMYNSVAADRHEMPVRSVVFLLRPEALAPANTGRVEDLVDPHCRLAFSYRLIRVWEMQVEAILAGGLGTLPLAPIAAVERLQLPEVYRRIATRLDRESEKQRADELWLATYILSGLRYPPDESGAIMRGVRQMRESATYQAILAEGLAEGRAKGLAEGRAEGLAEGERTVLIRVGTRRFGPPDERTLSRLRAITDAGRLVALGERLLDVNGWDALFDEGDQK